MVFKSEDPSSTGALAYCEDDALSMRRVGQTYRAIDIALRDPKPMPVHAQDLELIIDVAAAFMNIDEF
jgi:hypothetical protein